eukprot:TRINITY_DN15151_c0_g1_i1.p1 TRINITY_DN15151_c0_g1~~TRINITY_DN15151_c0_g1_i1.p1  ORF type:complete len:53 (-),score=1.31 TRINITY_DN15151_c0_g1_i1:84-242(-)
MERYKPLNCTFDSSCDGYFDITFLPRERGYLYVTTPTSTGTWKTLTKIRQST